MLRSLALLAVFLWSVVPALAGVNSSSWYQITGTSNYTYVRTAIWPSNNGGSVNVTDNLIFTFGDSASELFTYSPSYESFICPSNYNEAQSPTISMAPGGNLPLAQTNAAVVSIGASSNLGQTMAPGEVMDEPAWPSAFLLAVVQATNSGTFVAPAKVTITIYGGEAVNSGTPTDDVVTFTIGARGGWDYAYIGNTGNGGSSSDMRWPNDKVTSAPGFTVTAVAANGDTLSFYQGATDVTIGGTSYAGLAGQSSMFVCYDPKTDNPPSGNTINSQASGQLPTEPGLPAPPSAPVSGTNAPGTSSGDPTADSFFNGFWTTFESEMSKLFVPSSTSLTAIKNAFANITSWGPMGLMTSVTGIMGYAASLMSPVASTDPTYWYFYLQYFPGGGQNSLPASPSDYSSTTTYQAAQQNESVNWNTTYSNPDAINAAATIGPTMTAWFPRYIDCTPWAFDILVARGILLISIWVGFFLYLLRVVQPHIKL